MNDFDYWSTTTEYLILHEDEIDWEEISCKRIFSLVEIRLFRKNINWKSYIYRHGESMTTEMLELASKYFKSSHYQALGITGFCSEEFVLNHLNDFGVNGLKEYISSAKPSENFLLNTINYWKDSKIIIEEIQKYINPENFPSIKLLFEVE